MMFSRLWTKMNRASRPNKHGQMITVSTSLVLNKIFTKYSPKQNMCILTLQLRSETMKAVRSIRTFIIIIGSVQNIYKIQIHCLNNKGPSLVSKSNDCDKFYTHIIIWYLLISLRKKYSLVYDIYKEMLINY